MQDSEMIRNVAPEPALDRFPLTVKKGHASVKVYEVRNRDRMNYTVSYMTAMNGRVLKSAGIVSDVSVICEGEAKGHDTFIDGTTLA